MRRLSIPDKQAGDDLGVPILFHSCSLYTYAKTQANLLNGKVPIFFDQGRYRVPSYEFILINPEIVDWFSVIGYIYPDPKEYIDDRSG